MREIKFEILWVKNNFDFTKTIETHYTTLERLTSGVDGFPYSDVEVVAKRQYTGLKDKNGVEIYEGDVVKWGHIAGFTERNPRVAIVEMEIDLSFVTINLGENNHRFHYGNFIYKNTQAAMEVIGNIHQNPELLRD